MSEADTVVYNYLLSTASKLAKKFKKERVQTVPWNGPGLIELINLYKTSIQKPVTPVANGDDNTTSAPAPLVKKGKKRKISELEEKADDAVAVTVLPEAKKKKKKIKKNKKGAASPDVVEIIQDNKEEDKSEPETHPEHESTTENGAEQQTGITVGGLVGDVEDVEEKENDDENVPKKKSKKIKRGSQSTSSFRRVKEEDIVIKKAELADNAFEAKNGADDYGFKANQILKFTKGKSFRHEKTKKKRGTYKGGAINMGVTSIKFDSDSD